MIASLPDNEIKRLAILNEHAILDTAPQQEFDDLVRLAAHLCGTPIAAVSLIDEHRQWFKAIVGLEAQETPRDIAFCAHTILGSHPVVVADTTTDARFSDNPLVIGEPHVRFYAAVPLITEDGYALGSLCVVDQAPRRFTPEQEEILRLLARQVSSQLRFARQIAERERILRAQEHMAAERERLIAEREQTNATLRTEREFMQALLESLHEGIVACDANGTLTLFNCASREFHGLPEEPLPPECWAEHFDLYEADGLTPLPTESIPLFRAFQGETVKDAEMVIAARNGTSRTLLASGRSILDTDGNKLGAVVAMHDVTARKQIEREMARLAAIVESSEEAVYGATLEGTLVSWNNGAERLYGYAASEMIGRHVSYLVPQGQIHPITSVIPRLMHGEVIEAIEVERVRKDGTPFWAALSYSPIRSDSGEVIGVSIIARDISARKKAEAALAETYHRLRAVLESAPIILYTTDADGVVTLSEGTGLAALGLKPGEAVGRSVFDFTVDEAQHTATQRALAGETVSSNIQQGHFWLHTEMRPLRDASGSVTGMIGVCFDVTERALAEERFRVLFEQSSDAHLLCGGGKIIDCNAATLALFQCSDKAQLLTLHPSALSPELQPGRKRSQELGLEMEAQAREQGFHRFEWVHQKFHGEEFPVEVSLTPVTLAGKPVMLAVLHDLTDRKRAQQQAEDYTVVLQYQKAELENANAELERLATTDGLTGLVNHRTFQERLTEEVHRATRYGTPLSLIMLDVDHFKLYNDTFGHPAGDAVLRIVAEILRQCARETDVMARYGGEEFVVIVPQTDSMGARALAERIRQDIAQAAWPKRPITASLGVALLGPGMDGKDLVARSDKALYEAKAGGRNQIVHSHAAPYLAEEIK